MFAVRSIRAVPLAAAASVYAGYNLTRCTDAGSVDFAAVKEDIRGLIETDEAKRGDGTSLAGTFLRLAWHCSGTYSAKDGTGGSNGATMRFEPESAWGANAGLHIARYPRSPPPSQATEMKHRSKKGAVLWARELSQCFCTKEGAVQTLSQKEVFCKAVANPPLRVCRVRLAAGRKEKGAAQRRMLLGSAENGTSVLDLRSD
eukprot:scaffold470_cov257-Pinguiococcus_pyrenoidosus.AAC.34